ncbi:uncharacterized protein MELLADRAFT_89895 [Melampsora larici-populina 98AG31]|uniref:Nudix hydrolase domain-containing protein n=1 Tax=Melampsora larici-populina (strain 98AG31 / pathotype 3-4-7) TaxID=747676 RepID=F4RV10_MELLP|nr:uncharacterized protein MELLADRAFT_89895 [Melampsora larici-populina 98AG31]EGG03792.1 hypothetical protein MELLADRAFT_89895 [Melampsora larici-populina 98AG31]
MCLRFALHPLLKTSHRITAVPKRASSGGQMNGDVNQNSVNKQLSARVAKVDGDDKKARLSARSAAACRRRMRKPRLTYYLSLAVCRLIISWTFGPISLIIIKPLKELTKDGFNYHTLLLERNSTKGSFLSAHVFPGGNIEKDDSTMETSIDPNRSVIRSLKTCAIRETFEECGILVGTTVVDHDKSTLTNSIISDWRQRILYGSESFSNFVKMIKKEFGRDLKLDALTHHANYLTPLALPMRWDTHFFMYICPPDSTSSDTNSEAIGIEQANVDGLETVSMRWLTPLEGIKLATSSSTTDPEHQGLRLAPPQFYLLAELCSKLDYNSIFNQDNIPTRVDESCNVDGMVGSTRRIIEFIPEMIKPQSQNSNENSMSIKAISFQLVLPGDPQHSSTNKIIKNSPHLTNQTNGFKHRVYIRPPTRSPSKSSFFIPIGIERIGMENILGKGWEDVVIGEVD